MARRQGQQSIAAPAAQANASVLPVTELARIQAVESNQPTQRNCITCLEDKEIQEFTALTCCGYSDMCNPCLEGMVDTAIKEQTTNALRCPNQGCAQGMPQEQVHIIVRNNTDKFDAYCQVCTNEWVNRQRNSRHCPGIDCTFSYLFEGNAQIITCQQCNITYCSDCRINHSRNMSCAEARENQELGKDATKAERDTAAMLGSIAKPCPQCNLYIERTVGCDHMTCRGCQHEFCWVCGQDFWPNNQRGGGHHPIHCQQAETYHPLQPINRPSMSGASAAAAAAVAPPQVMQIALSIIDFDHDRVRRENDISATIGFVGFNGRFTQEFLNNFVRLLNQHGTIYAKINGTGTTRVMGRNRDMHQVATISIFASPAAKHIFLSHEGFIRLINEVSRNPAFQLQIAQLAQAAGE
jgi:hypothetical protein